MRQALIVFSVALKFINMIKAGIQCTVFEKKRYERKSLFISLKYKRCANKVCNQTISRYFDFIHYLLYIHVYLSFSIAAQGQNLNCNFDVNLCSWQQLKTDNGDWKLQSGPTSTRNTGPTSDHTSGSMKLLKLIIVAIIVLLLNWNQMVLTLNMNFKA